MPSSISIDLDLVAKDLNLPPAKVQRTVQLLDEGNTVPFITRYRKDQTGGLNEEQIQRIHQVTTRMRLLAERKQTVLKSIESQGKLTAKLAERIREARSTKRLEDLYLPYKPKKRSLATLARERGLEPFAHEILECSPQANDLDARAADFMSPDRELQSPAEVLHGVGHLMAERFSEHAELRSKLRRILHRTGQLVTSKVEASGRSEAKRAAPDSKLEPKEDRRETTSTGATETAPDVATPNTAVPDTAVPNAQESEAVEATSARAPPANQAAGVMAALTSQQAPPDEASAAAETQGPCEPEAPSGDDGKNAETARGSNAAKPTTAKGRKRQKLENAFKDYFDYHESISRIPPHRVLAINRGERARVLRVRIESDGEAMIEQATGLLVADDHPHAEFLRACVRDALTRLVLPSLEREIRRELSDKAEDHAVQVFIRNLRKLMLQPPIHGRRVVAVDPGYRSGCKLAAMDEFGNILESGVIHIIGSDAKRSKSRVSLVEIIRRQSIQVVAIGNGTACRETEQLVAEVLSDELKDDDVAYVIVNEAGASTYSTSPAGREELPDYDAVMRSAISIGRRLLDPLSELVKINPANIGVGLYQHDVKAKHLRESLDDVVALCVNFVGVDVNTASPALLSYVSGLNQLTARRLYDYRRANGPFRTRAQVRDVPGIGETSFVQAAGFLKITDGDNPLDATWIHPESYDVAQVVLTKLDSSVEELAGMLRGKRSHSAPEEKPAAAVTDAESATELPANSLVDRAASVDISGLAEELDVGEMLLKDILTSLTKPGRDPREDLPPPTFRRGIVKLEDLKPGMELSGTVLNVVDFGAFVDIGISDGALVHISRLADHYVKDPHEVVSVGDIITVWVIDVDKQRRRVSLTAIKPGGEPIRRDNRHAPSKRKKTTQPPSGARKPKGSRRSSPPHRAKTAPPKRAQKKPAKPITDAMVDGREPMRSFSDLVQFYEQKREPPDDSEPKSKD